MFFGNIGRFSDSGLDVCALGDANTNLVLAVAYDDKRLETETTSALDDACNTVDVYYNFLKFLWCL